MTGQTKIMKYIYSRKGGYIETLSKDMELVCAAPLSSFNIRVNTSRSSQASGVGENAGLTILNDVIATLGNRQNLNNLLFAVRIQDRLYRIIQWKIIATGKYNGIKVINYSFIMEEIYKEGTRTRSSK